jgi:hypothetical protein
MENNLLKKRKSRAFKKDIYLLGKNEDGEYVWLEEASWDCDWYWGFGYLETYTNNEDPSMSRDINSHSHFDGLDKNCNNESYPIPKEFVETTLTKDEWWKMRELMNTFYIMREYSDTINRGGAHQTSNPISDLIKNDKEYERINKVVLPKLFKEVYKLLTPKGRPIK